MTPATPEPSVAVLDILAGTWICEAGNPLEPSAALRSTTTFEWIEGGRFLIQRSTAAPPFPSVLALIGRETPDDAASPLILHYFDSRGVARLYTMTLADGTWTLARHGSDFSQRYRGTFSEDGNTITGAWERSAGAGTPLQHDFDLIYRRVT